MNESESKISSRGCIGTDYGTRPALQVLQWRSISAESYESRSLFRIVGFDAVTFQLRAQLGEILVVSRLNSATNIHGGDVRASKSTIMDDLFNACAAGCDLRG